MTKTWTRLFWLWIIFVVGVTTSPWDQIVTHAHFDKIHWIPFYGYPFLLGDIIENILLFVPLGWLYVVAHPGFSKGRALINVFVVSICLSLFVELTQIFIHTRFPAMADWLCNTTGGVLGGFIAVIWRETREKKKEISLST